VLPVDKGMGEEGLCSTVDLVSFISSLKDCLKLFASGLSLFITVQNIQCFAVACEMPLLL
jgi:hypothetical protein